MDAIEQFDIELEVGVRIRIALRCNQTPDELLYFGTGYLLINSEGRKPDFETPAFSFRFSRGLEKHSNHALLKIFFILKQLSQASQQVSDLIFAIILDHENSTMPGNSLQFRQENN